MHKKVKDIQIWCTVGPASLNQKVIARLEETGVSMFRINLSHTNIEEIEEKISIIKSFTSVPICLDTEGPQIRTGVMNGGAIFLDEGSIVDGNLDD